MRAAPLLRVARLAWVALALCVAAGDGVAQATDSLDALARARSLLTEGRPAEAESLARTAVAEREARYGRESLETAEALEALVQSLSMGGRGKSAGAREFGERAVDIRERLQGREHPDVAKSLHALATLLWQSGDYDGAQPLHERALAIREKALGPDHADVAASLSGLGNLALRKGDYLRAKEMYERALAIQENALGPESAEVARTLHNLGQVLAPLGDYARARAVVERSLAIRVRLLGPDHRDVANAMRNLAGILRAIGDLEASRSLYEQALAIYERKLAPDDPTIGTCLIDLGAVNAAAGEFARARPFIERGLPIVEKALGPEHPNFLVALINLASVLTETGDAAAAIPHYERIVEIYAGLGRERHPAMAEALWGLGLALDMTGDALRARAAYERAIAIVESTLGPSHPDLAQHLVNLARLRFESGEADSALAEALRAEEIRREHFRLTARTLAEREALRYASKEPRGLDLALEIAANEPAGARSRAAWDALVRSRALVLDEMAARHAMTSSASDSVTSSRSAALDSARVVLARMIVRGIAGDEPNAYRARILEARAAKESAERALGATSATFRAAQERLAIGLDDVAAALPAEWALVAYARYLRVEISGDPIDRSEPAYVAFALPDAASEPLVVPLGAASEIDPLVARWADEATAGATLASRSAAKSDSAYQDAGRALRERIWDPVASRLAGSDRAFVIPDGSMHLVNLAALPAKEGGFVLESGPLLHLLNAERDLVDDRATTTDGNGFIAIGAPDFDSPAAPSAVRVAHADHATGLDVQMALTAPVEAYRGAAPRCGDFQHVRFAPLPASQKELEEIAHIWDSNRGDMTSDRGERADSVDGRAMAMAAAETFTGRDANEYAFKLAVPGHRILHVATHGFFLARACISSEDSTRGIGGLKPVETPTAAPVGENPLLLSGLALAAANLRDRATLDEEDGILTAEEVASLDLSGVEWAVLSGCETGVGEIAAGEGVFGLRRAFQTAGARTVLMSLWSVKDESAREWMRHLYAARLAEHMTTAEAVRAASLATLEARRHAHQSTHPFWWGAFVASGDWR